MEGSLLGNWSLAAAGRVYGVGATASNTCVRILASISGFSLRASGAIRTKLAETFVRAEVIPSETYVTARDLRVAKAQNLVRLVGADEILQDGDIIQVRARG